MSSYEQEPSPEFDFGPDAPGYDPEFVSDMVLWQLVEDKLHTDWREETDVGDPFRYPRSVTLDGSHMIVVLGADTDCEYEDEGGSDEPFLTASVSLRIEEKMTTSDPRRNLIFREAYNAIEGLEENMDEDYMTVRAGIQYVFRTSGSWDIRSYQAILDEDGNDMWRTFDPEDYEDNQADIREHDLDAISRALTILKAPEHIQESLAAIRAGDV